MNFRRLAPFVAIGLAMAGCIADDQDSTSGTLHDERESNLPTGAFGQIGLLFDSSCEIALERIKEVALTEVTPWGLETDYWRQGPVLAVEPAMEFDDAGAPDMAESSQGSGAPEFSETNTQEIGVDEGDILETNGTHIFKADSSGISVIDVSTLEVKQAAVLPEGQHHLILHEDRLAVVSSLWSSWDTTHLRIFSVTGDGNLELETTEILEGRTVGVRSVDGHLRILLETSNRDQLDFVSPWENNLSEEEALKHNTAQIEQSTIEQWIPRIAEGTQSEVALECNQIAISEQSATAAATTWVVTKDVHSPDPARGQLGIMSRADTMYATAGSVHFTTATWNDDVEWPRDPGVETAIHSFKFNANDTMYHLASGTVQGETIGQFALNEYGDQLRIATTRSVDGVSESAVTILTAGDDHDYEVLGEVGGLGLTERIYAVRYIGDLAYVVTFRQTDPLYVVDLTDPTNPYAAGELKIPGYSSYLHPIGEGKLLGIGQDADNNGRTRGTQISLFDVSDPTNPLRLDQVDIGGSSAAEYDHKAFLWWAPGQFTATANYDGTVTVTRVDNTDSFMEPVELESPIEDECSWWNSDTRTVVIGDSILTVGSTHLSKYDASSLRLIDSNTFVETNEASSGGSAFASEPVEPDIEPWC